MTDPWLLALLLVCYIAFVMLVAAFCGLSKRKTKDEESIDLRERR